MCWLWFNWLWLELWLDCLCPPPHHEVIRVDFANKRVLERVVA